MELLNERDSREKKDSDRYEIKVACSYHSWLRLGDYLLLELS